MQYLSDMCAIYTLMRIKPVTTVKNHRAKTAD